MRAVCIPVLLILLASAGWLVAGPGIFARAIRCDNIDFVDPPAWEDHYRQAMRDEAESRVTIAGQDLRIIGSICGLNAEKGLPEVLRWEFLHSYDIAWRVNARSDIGNADLFLLKRDSEPLYYGWPKSVVLVALINKSDGSFVHLEGSGSMTVGRDGTVNAHAGALEVHAGSLTGAAGGIVAVRLMPKAGQMGSSTVELDGDTVLLNGIIGLQTYAQLRDVVMRAPEPRTVIFENVEGTYSYSATAYSGRLIRAAGWNTYARRESEIYSGGVDLFLSGVHRTVESGADFGVHPGCCFAGMDGGELPVDHLYHRQLTDYSNEMLGAPAGSNFYNFTNRIVPHEKLRLLSDDDLLRWGVATEIIPYDYGSE